MPLTEHGFRDASCDPVVIETWWWRWPKALIGVPTGSQVGGHRAQARWAINLADRGLVRLHDFERRFLGNVARPYGRLSGKQQPIWEDLLPEISRRSGRVPP